MLPINCENATAADLPAIKKAEAAANSATTADSGTSGAAMNPNAFKTLEKLLIDYKPGVNQVTVKKVSVGCPVHLRNQAELYYDNVSSIVSAAVVDFDCIIPTEICFHEERTFPCGNGKTITIIATRTYFVIPKQPLVDSEITLQLEHKISTMLKETFGYTLPQTLDSRPLSIVDDFLDELISLRQRLESLTQNILFGRNKVLRAILEGISNLINKCNQLLLVFKQYHNLEEKVLVDKEELELQLFQLEQLKQQYEQLTRQQEEIIRQAINTGCSEHQRQTFDDAIRKVQDFMQASLDAMKKLKVSPEVIKEMEWYFHEHFEFFLDDLQRK